MRVVVALAAAALFTAPAGAGSVRPSGLPDCLGKPRVKPAAMVLACGDANFGLRQLHWIGWGEAAAAATGIAYANDCEPYGAAGHFHDYRAVIVADRAHRCGSTTVYSRLTVAFVGPTPYPKANVADLVYTFRCR